MNEQIKHKISRVLNHPARIPAAVGVVSFISGAGLGYILGKRRRVEAESVPFQMEFDFNERSTTKWSEIIELTDEESHNAKENGKEIQMVEEAVAIEEVDSDQEYRETAAKFVSERLQRTIEQNQASSSEVEDSPVATKNVFAEDDEDWNYEEELKSRSSAAPYVLHRDEFFADEIGYTQLTLTYYEGDNIMVDQEEAPVYNFKEVVGPLQFGKGSNDPNAFYIRNDKRRAEYEVLRHEGHYTVEVLGLEIEHNERVKDRAREHDLKHADRKHLRLE